MWPKMGMKPEVALWYGQREFTIKIVIVFWKHRLAVIFRVRKNKKEDTIDYAIVKKVIKMIWDKNKKHRQINFTVLYNYSTLFIKLPYTVYRLL